MRKLDFSSFGVGFLQIMFINRKIFENGTISLIELELKKMELLRFKGLQFLLPQQKDFL